MRSENFSEVLAARMRRPLASRKQVTEKKMFGGVCFLLRGNMLCGTGKTDFMFRVGKEQDAEALSRKGARPMDITGKVMKGFVWVDPKACDAHGLKRWIDLAEKYVGRLPSKKVTSSKRRAVAATRDIRTLKGTLPKLAKPVSVEDMNRAVRRRGLPRPGRAEKGRQFIADAYTALADFERDGKGYALSEITRHYRAKLQGRKSRKPKLRSWRT